MKVKQEMILERHWTCNICGDSGVETAEKQSAFEAHGHCCGSTRIREVPGQLLLSDHRGAWIRRR
jgi:hypothetical protein